jgi:hypothetical protein
MQDKELLSAIKKVQEKVPIIKPNAENNFLKNKYATWGQVVSKSRPIVFETGLMVIQTPITLGTDYIPALNTKIIHLATGQNVESTFPIAYRGDDSQKLGSALTYTKRYMWVTMLGLIVDADDDGNLAAGLAVNKQSNKDSAVDFWETRSKLVKVMTKAHITKPEQKELIQNTLGKDNVETNEDVKLVYAAAKKYAKEKKVE